LTNNRWIFLIHMNVWECRSYSDPCEMQALCHCTAQARRQTLSSKLWQQQSNHTICDDYKQQHNILNRTLLFVDEAVHVALCPRWHISAPYAWTTHEMAKLCSNRDRHESRVEGFDQYVRTIEPYRQVWRDNTLEDSGDRNQYSIS
jgi:hypothetical protein